MKTRHDGSTIFLHMKGESSFHLFLLLVSQLQRSKTVIPAEAGIQSFQKLLHTRFHGGDTFFKFCNCL